MLVVANPGAGSASALQAALAVLRSAGDVEVVTCAALSDLDAALASPPPRRLVVAGGDGTVHAVVSRLWRQGELGDVTVGILPLGTGNDLVTGLGLPPDPAEAAEVCLHGSPRRLDLLSTGDGEVVVNASHAGLGAAAAERSSSLKPALGPAAYPLGALIAGVRESAWDLTVTVDGQRVSSGPTLMVGVANAPSIGGGTRLVPPALPDDGLLDVVVVQAVAAAARVAFAVALRDEAHLDRPDVVHVRGREVSVEGDAVVHDADGELSEPLPARTYRVEPGAWTVLLPARG